MTDKKIEGLYKAPDTPIGRTVHMPAVLRCLVIDAYDVGAGDSSCIQYHQYIMWCCNRPTCVVLKSINNI